MSCIFQLVSRMCELVAFPCSCSFTLHLSPTFRFHSCSVSRISFLSFAQHVPFLSHCFARASHCFYTSAYSHMHDVHAKLRRSTCVHCHNGNLENHFHLQPQFPFSFSSRHIHLYVYIRIFCEYKRNNCICTFC